jgi:hypothetical protein
LLEEPVEPPLGVVLPFVDGVVFGALDSPGNFGFLPETGLPRPLLPLPDVVSGF